MERCEGLRWYRPVRGSREATFASRQMVRQRRKGPDECGPVRSAGSGHTEVRQVPDGTRHFLKTQPITKVVGYFHWVRADEFMSYTPEPHVGTAWRTSTLLSRL
jgi:hypothetical protein